MEKTVRIVGAVKWMAIVPGLIMFIFTKGSFGTAVSAVLAVIAAAAFWMLMRKEQSRLIGQTIADEIRAAISEAADVDSMIEVKRLRSGVIARVYLINAKDKVALVHKAVTRRIERCSLKKYLWILQMTDMPGRNALRETQKALNEQLLEELLERRRENRE